MTVIILQNFQAVFGTVVLLVGLGLVSCLGSREHTFGSFIPFKHDDETANSVETFEVGEKARREYNSHNNVTWQCHCHGSADELDQRQESLLQNSKDDDIVRIHIDMDTGAASLTLQNDTWIHLMGHMQSVVGWNNNLPLHLESTSIINNHIAPEYERFGPYTNVTFVWTSPIASVGQISTPTAGHHVVHTSFLIFQKRQMIIFEQNFQSGWSKPGTSIGTNEQRKLQEHLDMPKIVSGFPIINLTLPKDDLMYMSWGDCMLSNPQWGEWRDVDPNDYTNFFDADQNGQPWILHDSEGRTLVWSNLNDFFVTGFGAKESVPLLDIGLRTTLNSIPPGHKHTSILVTGRGINNTVMEWGDILLQNGEVSKERTHVYDDFTLAMLGYWTDNGAYHYTGATGPDYSNMEEALVAIKNGMKEKGIPIRYIQWDDWWMETLGDIPGILSWTPKKEVFPSGFSDWLGMPLAMYAPEYASVNVWADEYSWKIDKNTAIPLDPNFYQDLFSNGTSIGMKSFEQDFLCYYGIGKTTLTNSDVNSGKAWLGFMDKAAQRAGIKIQLCMPNAYHILQSTVMPSVSNARGTGDNTRDYPSILSMGQNTLLYYALGIFNSRDNTWTSTANINQAGCGNTNFCYEPNAALDNAVAVLSGGPYGIADGLPFVNKTVVMYSCRSDGLLLRPMWPLASLECTFKNDDAKGSLVWASHDDHTSFRWSYIVGVNLTKEIALTPSRLSNENPRCCCQKMVAWEVTVGRRVEKVFEFSESSPFMLPTSKPLDLPYEVNTPPHTHYNAAPVLPSGMVFLGETDKWATMSFGRIHSLRVDGSVLSMEVHGAPSETATFSYLLDMQFPNEIEEVACSFPSSCSLKDQHGNMYCRTYLTCSTPNGCECHESQFGYSHLRKHFQ
ncbi:hypothetical protein IV203_015694 [Nitzschia inconspicua]|uniref:Uncharacterized protein n=1 Tax=Nitzschia inconspicua TaxID=303405 RepID=A0A9K3LB45_9STRA|nr:hypothetical protein IV203_015694 [Nitzschia inconspicua]